MAQDRFSAFSSSPTGPGTTIFEITPDDGADLAETVSALNVETPGQVRVTTKEGTVGTVSVAAGIVFPLRVAKVWATGTTATGIRGLV